MILQPVTLLLLIANLVAYVHQIDAHEQLTAIYGLWPWGNDQFRYWQLVSYSFLHDNGNHLGFNMIGLFMFGVEIEYVIGSLKFLFYYFVCVVVAALVQLAMTIMLVSSAGYTIGASGAVFGLLLAYGMLFPKRKLLPMVVPLPIPAWLFVTLYGLMELWLGVTQTQAGVAHFAHLGGMMGGWLLMQYWCSNPPPEASDGRG